VDAKRENDEGQLLLTRLVDAPRELVWRAWTQREHLQQWWGPKGFTWVRSTLELRPGGLFHYCMRSPDGQEMWGKLAFREVAEPERLEFVASFSDAEGRTVRAPFSPDWPLEVLSTVTFEKKHDRTKITLRGAPIHATEAERRAFAAGHGSMQKGWAGTFEQLDEHVTEGREISAERLFEAPRPLVWRAFTEAEHVARWWGPRGFRTTVQKMDVRVGGEWDHVMHGPDGTDYPNRHVYVEIVENERLVMDHATAPEFRTTVLFSDEGAGRTRVRWRMVFPSAELRDTTIRKYGAAEGLTQNLEKLVDHLAGMGAAREMVLTRLIDAPPQMVFDAWSRPEHLARWFGPRGFTLPGCDVDFRVGGAYRFVMRGPDGTDYPFHGVYREIVAPSRLVFSAIIEGGPPEELTTTVDFVEEAGKTRLTVRQTTPPTPHGRGQEQGWSESLVKLADLLNPL
jgi:uncharacterized protein YndB with AHSA1/START domain